MKYGISHNRILGIAALALMAVIAVFGLGGGKLASERAKVERMFYDGVLNDGLSIYNDMRTRVDESYSLITIANKYLDSSSSEIAALQQAADGLGAANTEDVVELFEANNQMTLAAKALSDKLDSERLSAKDETLFARSLDEMESRNSTISHDPYNSYAADFNATLKRFPAGLIGALRGVRELQYYR